MILRVFWEFVMAPKEYRRLVKTEVIGGAGHTRPDTLRHPNGRPLRHLRSEYRLIGGINHWI